MKRTRTIIVTGGSGFVGSALIEYWRNQYPADQVVNCDRLQSRSPEAAMPHESQTRQHRLVHVQADVCDYRAMCALLASFRPAYVVHCAAQASTQMGISHPSLTFSNNVIGTQTVLEAIRQSGVPTHFHYVSTYLVYGDAGAGDSLERLTEHSFCKAVNPYSASKAAAEQVVMAYYGSFRTKSTISRSSNNYGPYPQSWGVIPRFVAQALLRQPLVIHGDGRQSRDWVHVRDHCRAIDRILTRGTVGGIYNVGSNCEVSVEELADTIISIIDPSGGSKVHVAQDHGRERRCKLDWDLIRRELRWKPAEDFSTSFRETVEWYRHHGEALSPHSGTDRQPRNDGRAESVLEAC